MENVNPVLDAIRTQRGFAGVLGKKLGITREAVWMWRKVPPKHAVSVARFMRLPVHDVCPEVFPEPRRRKPHDLNSSRPSER